MTVDHEAAEPLYRQLAGLLRAQIASGELSGRVPSLTRLSAQHGVADRTVRAALKVLAGEGLIETVPGRGTFVTGRGKR